jgi:hypothetical protein
MKFGSAPLYLLALTAVLVATTAGLSPACADLHVIESTAPSIKVGSQLADRDSITIPAGGQIRVVLPSGKTQTIRGPFTGTVAELVKGQPRNEGVLVWLKDFLKTGGATEATPGATRSIGREAPKPRVGFSWSAVPVTMDGNVCIEKDARLQLVRAPSSPADRVAVIDASTSERGEAQWEAGSDAAAWPANLTPRPDGTYHILMGDRPPRRITLRVLPKLPADEDVLTELHKLGCKQQFEAWVRERVASGKRG